MIYRTLGKQWVFDGVNHQILPVSECKKIETTNKQNLKGIGHSFAMLWYVLFSKKEITLAGKLKQLQNIRSGHVPKPYLAHSLKTDFLGSNQKIFLVEIQETVSITNRNANSPAVFIPRGFGEPGNSNLPFLEDWGI